MSLECYPMTATIARRAGALKNASARKGRTLSTGGHDCRCNSARTRTHLDDRQPQGFFVPGTEYLPIALIWKCGSGNGPS